MITAPEQQVAPHERFELRELISAFNRRLDRGDIDALREMSLDDVSMTFDGTLFIGVAGLREFVEHQRSTAAVARRTHVNHVQAWRRGDRLVSRSMTLITALVATPSMIGDGSPQPNWVGFVEDEFVERDGWRFASRKFSRWGDDVLARFAIEQGETA